MATATINVSGMTCGHCVAAVERALQAQAGVQEARVDLNTALARVSYDERETGTEALVRAVEGQGYTASVSESGTPADT